MAYSNCLSSRLCLSLDHIPQSVFTSSFPPRHTLPQILPCYPNVCNQSNSFPIHQRVNTFTTVFRAAETEYQKITGERLNTSPLAAKLDSCHSPKDIFDLLRTQAQAFSKFHEGDEKLIRWLKPTVNILFTYSDTLAIRLVYSVWVFANILFSPAKTIFTGIRLFSGWASS